MSETAPSTETTSQPTDGDAADPLAALDQGSVIGGAKVDGDKPKPEGGEGDKPEGEGDKPADDGKPVAGSPEAYDLKMPEGVTMDAEAWKLAEPAFRDANLGPEQAQKLAEAFPAIAQGIVDRHQQALIGQIAEQRKTWAAETRNDPDIGGANFDANLAVVARARDELGSPAFTQFLTDTGLGDHPDMFRMLLKAGRAIGEGTIHTGAAPPATAQTAAERVYGPGWGPKPEA